MAITYVDANANNDTADPADVTVAIGALTGRKLIVGFSTEGTYVTTINSVTFNPGGAYETAGVYINRGQVGASPYNGAELWYVDIADNVPSDTYTVRLDKSASGYYCNNSVIALAGCATGDPEANQLTTDGSVSVINSTLTTLTNNAWIVDTVNVGDTRTITFDDGQTSRWTANPSSASGAGSTLPVASAGSTNTGWSLNSASTRLIQIAASFPVGGTTFILNGAASLTVPAPVGGFSNQVRDLAGAADLSVLEAAGLLTVKTSQGMEGSANLPVTECSGFLVLSRLHSLEGVANLPALQLQGEAVFKTTFSLEGAADLPVLEVAGDLDSSTLKVLAAAVTTPTVVLVGTLGIGRGLVGTANTPVTRLAGLIGDPPAGGAMGYVVMLPRGAAGRKKKKPGSDRGRLWPVTR